MQETASRGLITPGLAPRWAAGIVIVLVLAVLGVLHETAFDMWSIWMRSGTFTHAVLVLPITIWLLWEKRAELVRAGFVPTALPLLFVVGSALLWVMGEAVSAAVVSHFALVFLIISVVWMVWGHRAAWQVAFPLGFLLFAVPFGEFMVPTLMHYTAEFTVALVRLSGVPVYQEGQSFVIPSGRWSVVEACSGIRYLIASFMVGVLYAWLNYRSLKRRTLFVLASLLVPLGANWLRAYMIVMLGHFSGNELAVGADHLVYGWVFFGIVIGLLFWIGGRWREDLDAPASAALDAEAVSNAAPDKRQWILLACCVLTLVVQRPLLGWLVMTPGASAYRIPAVQAVAGWQYGADSAANWRLLLEGERTRSQQVFVQNGLPVTLQIGYFAQQSEGHELVAFGNRLIESQNNLWSPVSDQGVSLPQGSFHLNVFGGEDGRLLVLSTYWLGDRVSSSEHVAKLALLKARLLRQPDDSAYVTISAPVRESEAKTREALERFVTDNWQAVASALQTTAQR